jgi:predicted alpha/beta-hydrolase family hydrolase
VTAPTGTLETGTLAVPEAGARVSTLLLRPPTATHLYVLAHGAGAGMRHPFMEAVAVRLAARGIATLRYQFPYLESGSRRPDSQPTLLATVRAAVAAAAETAPDLPLLAGGKSMGGRMTTLAASEAALERVRGIVLLGFPLHPPGARGTARAQHLDRVRTPMLYLQGTRDTLADPELMRGVCERLGARATLEMIEGADHSFHVLKRSGRTDDQVLDQVCDTVAAWAKRVARGGAA